VYSENFNRFWQKTKNSKKSLADVASTEWRQSRKKRSF